MNATKKIIFTSLSFVLFGLLFVLCEVAFSQDATPEIESSQSATVDASLPSVPKQSDNLLASTTLALLWTLALFVVLVCLVKFASPGRFRSSSGAFKTVESSFIMRGKVELATVAWRDKLILIARSGDSVVKLSEVDAQELAETEKTLTEKD